MWDMASVNELTRDHPANDNSPKMFGEQLPFEFVDQLADELVIEFNNPEFRRWYCGVINKYGRSRVLEWRRRANEGKHPGRLFTSYVNQAGGYRGSTRSEH